MFAKEADVYIMDEPTASLDQVSKNCLYHELYGLKKDKIIIIISHDKELILMQTK